MSEWWTYRLRDFLMFSPRTYARMYEIYNEALWPLNALAALIAFALLFIAVRMTFPLTKTAAIPALNSSAQSVWQRAAQIAVFTYFAIAHLWIALVFMREYYAPIFWAAEYFAAALVAQAVLFAVAAVLAVRSRDAFRYAPATWPAAIGVGIASFAAIVHPTILFGIQSKVSTIEAVGVAPDPTAIASLGFLLLIRPGDAKRTTTRFARYLWRAMIAVALVWCVVAFFTLLAMQSPLALVPMIALIGYAFVFIVKRPIYMGDTKN
jgi:hypothetical protein